MEPRDPQGHDEQERSDPPQGRDRQEASDSARQGEPATEDAGPEAPQVVGTDAPLIAKGPAVQTDWANQPDRNMVIQTSRIREPNQAFSPSFVMVPVETDRPSPEHSGSGNGEGKMEEGHSEKGGQDKGRKDQGGHGGQNKDKDAQARSEGGRDEDRGGAGGRDADREKSGDRHKDERGQPSGGPSLMKTLLLAGAVALVCGVVGAWGYSYFFGPEKSGGKSSGEDSGSSKDSGGGSGSSNDSGGGSGSSKGSGSGKGSDTRKNSTSNDKNSNAGKLVEAEMAWLAAVKELNEAKKAEKKARESDEEKKAILDFLKMTLLSAGRPGSGSLSAAFWSGGQGKDVSLRQALDATDARMGEMFADRPRAEAATRELLGLAYLNVGEPEKAVQEYQRALALWEATQGPNAPESAACRNQLAVVYRVAGRTNEAGRLFDRDPNAPGYADALAARGATLLLEKKPAEAELKLRECLTIRRKARPDDWTTFDTESALGEALAAQKKYGEAEPLLISGYEGLKQHEDAIPPQDRPRLARALERLVTFYEARGQQDMARKWREELGATATDKRS